MKTFYRARTLGLSKQAVLVAGASLVILGLLIYALLPETKQTTFGTQELVMYCAAGIRKPVEAAAKRYEEEFGISVRLQFAGSNALLSQIEAAQMGDLYLAADQFYIDKGRAKGIIKESIPLAYQKAVIAVRKDDQKINSIEDLLEPNCRLAIANLQAAVGKTTKGLLEKSGHWKAIKAHVEKSGVFKPTVVDVANHVKLGSVDAGIIWDASVAQYPELKAIEIPAWNQARKHISVGVLSYTKHPTQALRFARYLGARDRGLEAFEAHNYQAVDGDRWAVSPTVMIFSGTVNKIALEPIFRKFMKREGCTINTTYNGCGILVSQMKGLAQNTDKDGFPDAYFACDTSFIPHVHEHFAPPLTLTQTNLVIITPKGNPKQIKTPEDLVREDAVVGIADYEKSALGELTKRLLTKLGLYEKLLKKGGPRAPTGDLLVAQLAPGADTGQSAMDAAIVYEVNANKQRDKIEIIHIDHPQAKAFQPYTVANYSGNKHLLNRLIAYLNSPENKAAYEQAGFTKFKAPSQP